MANQQTDNETDRSTNRPTNGQTDIPKTPTNIPTHSQTDESTKKGTDPYGDPRSTHQETDIHGQTDKTDESTNKPTGLHTKLDKLVMPAMVMDNVIPTYIQTNGSIKANRQYKPTTESTDRTIPTDKSTNRRTEYTSK